MFRAILVFLIIYIGIRLLKFLYRFFVSYNKIKSKVNKMQNQGSTTRTRVVKKNGVEILYKENNNKTDKSDEEEIEDIKYK